MTLINDPLERIARYEKKRKYSKDYLKRRRELLALESTEKKKKAVSPNNNAHFQTYNKTLKK